MRDEKERRWAFTRAKGVLKYLATAAAYSGLVALATALGLLGGGSLRAESLTLVLFLEGGSGMLLGVLISLSSTPSIARLGETLFETASWSREAEKHAEKVGFRWMLASTFLVLMGFVASAI